MNSATSMNCGCGRNAEELLTAFIVPGAGIAVDKPFVDHSWQEVKS